MTRLESERLLLESPQENDAAQLAEGLAEFEVSKNLASAPHPYSLADAKDFIARVTESRAKGEGYCFVIRLKADGRVIGTCGLRLKEGRYEMGYWVAKPFWKLGFATEAAARLLHFAFDDLKASEVWAGWFHDNLASGRVLGKLGFEAQKVEKQPSLARGADILCNRTRLTRERFGRKKALFEAPARVMAAEQVSAPADEPIMTPDAA